MLNLQHVVDRAYRQDPELQEHSVDLGAEIHCVTRTWQGQPRTEYRVRGRLAATAFLDEHKSPRITVEPALNLDPTEILPMMMALAFAASRAGQMSYAAFNRPTFHTMEVL